MILLFFLKKNCRHSLFYDKVFRMSAKKKSKENYRSGFKIAYNRPNSLFALALRSINNRVAVR